MINSQPFSMEARQLARLMEVSLTLNSTLDLDDLLQYIIKCAVEILDCEAASLLLYDEKRNRLFFAASTGVDVRKSAQMLVPLDGSLAGAIFREGEPILINDVRQDARHFASISQKLNFDARSFLGVPMRIRDKGVGVLEALNHRDGNFTQTEQRLLSVLASQAAGAVYNARLIQALQQAYEEISETDRLKSNFLALASHELRTPLGMIIGYASFLQEEKDDEISENAERVLQAANQMRSVIEAMTSLHLLQAKSMTFNLRPISIQEVLVSAVEAVRHLADDMDHTIVFDLPSTPLLVTADHEKLTPAFVNIINNAIRFTPRRGTITIGAAAVDGNISTWVRDTGIGLDRDQLTRIFQEFYQVESHTTRRYGGLGIGLTIAKGLVENLGGNISAESDGLGNGTVIQVVLPPAGNSSILTNRSPQNY
jgi:signal transduction histidine kinase